jgi:signal transduction histidine kinase/DNA-binding NarL/FixJ family response regulator/HPt (histidine-containing phosphotransfer) domain-containing protein
MRKYLLQWIRTYWAVFTAMLLAVGFSMIYTVYARYSPLASTWTGYIIYGTKNLGVMYVAAVGGIVPALGAVLLIFTLKLLIFAELTYTSFIYLVLALAVYAFSRRRMYGRLRYVPLITLILTTLSGPGWGLLLELSSGTPVGRITAARLLWYGINALPEALLSTLSLCFLFRCLPEKALRQYPMGVHFLSASEAKENDTVWKWRHHVSNRVAAMVITISLIIAIYGALASSVLLPSLLSRQNASPETLAAVVEVWGDITSSPGLEQYTAIQETILGSEAYNFGMPTISYILRLMMLVTSGVIPIAVIANYYARFRIVDPIVKMSDAVDRILREADTTPLTERAELIHTLNIATGDELEILYHALERAVDSTVGFVDALEAQKKLENDLAVAKATNQARSSFLSNISHEIRTPINAILGMDELILRETREDFTIRYAKNIQGAGKSLLGLINDVLDFSKIDAGKMDIIPVEYDLMSLINDVVNLIMIRAKDKGLEFYVNVDPSTPQVLFGDEIRIKQCIINILTNAVKYTEKGSVTLDVGYRSCDEPDEIMLSMFSFDTGIGIREEDMAVLEEAFQRVDEVRNRTTEGTGLGMSITGNLLDMMGSRLEAKSEYGKGSVFGFSVKQKIIQNAPIGDFAEKYANMEEQAAIAQYQARFQAPDARILIVDDTKANLLVAAGLLRHTRVMVDTALSGPEMLAKSEKQRYDMIFLDYRMPEMDGVEALHALRKLENNPNESTPVIALTANAISGAREMFMEAGFSDYMSKPIQGERLEALVEKYLPVEVILHAGDPGYLAPSATQAASSAPGSGSEVLRAFFAGSGMDYDAALEACGSEDLLLTVLTSFVEDIPKTVKNLQTHLSTCDWKEYTVIVHALKNSARLIGATELSGMAKNLEDAGNREDESEIRSRTPAFLARYETYLTYLAAFLPAEEADESLPEIPEEDLLQALNDIRECAEGFDFRSAAEIMDMLGSYRIPESRREQLRELADWIRAADRQSILANL